MENTHASTMFSRVYQALPSVGAIIVAFGWAFGWYVLVLSNSTLEESLPSSVVSHTSHTSSMLIVTAVQPKQCASTMGSYINVLSIKNKQDYARLHGYQLYVGTNQVDPLLKGPWNKMALLKRLMETTSYTWFMWIDADAMFVDHTFKIPFDKYEGRNLIIWGDEKSIFDVGDAHMGTNSGVFLIRNTVWGKTFVDEVCSLGGPDREQELVSGLANYEGALFDQNAFVYILKKRTREASLPHIVLENQYLLNGYWKDLPASKLASVRPFISHFSGCQFCSGVNKKEAEACDQTWMDTYKHGNQLAWDMLRTKG